MKTIVLIATLAAPVAALTAAPEENAKLPPERLAEIAALMAAE